MRIHPVAPSRAADPRLRHTLVRTWLLCTSGLLALYCSQKLLEMFC